MIQSKTYLEQVNLFDSCLLYCDVMRKRRITITCKNFFQFTKEFPTFWKKNMTSVLKMYTSLWIATYMKKNKKYQIPVLLRIKKLTFMYQNGSWWAKKDKRTYF
jgi:hypothetical protein